MNAPENFFAATKNAAWEVKPLNSEFNSLGEALFSYTEGGGFASHDEKNLNSTCVSAFLHALGLTQIFGGTKMAMRGSEYFESDKWFFDYVEANGFIRTGTGIFFKLDEYFRPVGYLNLNVDTHYNIEVDYCGEETMMKGFLEVVKANIKNDPTVAKKTSYVEVKHSRGMMGGSTLECTFNTIENPRVARPEYYPYIEDGIEALIREFVQSEESVLILIGPPGTGKSSLVAAAVDAIGLLPIYAKKADVINDKDFVGFVFECSDKYMSKIAGTAAKARADLFVETLTKEREFGHKQPLVKREDEEKEEPRVPVIVVEDADILLSPRSEGNLIMPELLNATDGMGSNHTRKIIFTTNLANVKGIDSALMRPGRCFDVVHCRLLTPDEAIAARAANGLPPFEVLPTKDISLAEALRKPRKRISVSNGKATLGFNS